MTKLFLKQYKKLACYDCTVKSTKYSMCSVHLEKARDQFKIWSLTRRMIGKCIRCNRKSFKDQLRCSLHRLLSNQQCKSWHKKNKKHVADYTVARREYWRKQGLCFKCPQHRPLTDYLNCTECRARQQGYNKRSI